MSEKIKVLLSEEEVDSRIKQIAAKVSKDYAGKEIHLICVLKGGVFFTCELAKRITVPVSLDFMSVSSYGDDTKSSGVVTVSYTHLFTQAGKLVIKGEQLHVKQLDLEKGEVDLEGKVDSLTYLSKNTDNRDESLFRRMFR